MRRLENTHISVFQGTDRNQPHELQPDDDLDAYPAHIFETAIQCSSRSLAAKTPFCPLWNQILSYWFPRSAGFKVEEGWQPDLLNPYLQQPPIMAVLYQGQPIVLLYLEGSQEYFDGLPQRKLREVGNRAFDTISIWSGLPAMCVIAAMDQKWSSFIRPTEMTSGMVHDLIGYDWYGDFGDEVLSLASYQALKQYFNVLKASCT